MAKHGDGDACLGEPLCLDCWDYAAAVVWNNTLGELWRRTTIYVRRALARHAGMTQRRLNLEVRPAYAKVSEFQKRGLIRLHVLVRLDRAMPKYRHHEIHPPEQRFDAELLEQALRTAAAEVFAPIPDELGGGRITWGSEVDVRELRAGEERGKIASYLAKYATKSTELAGGLLHRVGADTVERAPVREHVRNLMAAAHVLDAIATTHRKYVPAPMPIEPAREIETDWNPAALAIRVRRAMGDDELLRVRLPEGPAHIGRVVRITDGRHERRGTTLVIELDSGELVHLADVASIGPADRRTRRRERREPRLAASAHAFGYRGHCLTKSRRYSTTFKQLRADREAWVHEQILARSRDAAQRALAGAVERTVALECDGVGHVTAADEYYATSEAARARERRRIGREECSDQPRRARKATRRATGDEPLREDESDREAIHDG